MEDMLTTDYDGCGRCLVGVRRLSRKTDKTSSPQRQGDQILQATGDAGGHIIAWADDWEVSGATDPLTRRGFGPWLRGEMGPYDGSIRGIDAPRVGQPSQRVVEALGPKGGIPLLGGCRVALCQEFLQRGILLCTRQHDDPVQVLLPHGFLLRYSPAPTAKCSLRPTRNTLNGASIHIRATASPCLRRALVLYFALVQNIYSTPACIVPRQCSPLHHPSPSRPFPLQTPSEPAQITRKPPAKGSQMHPELPRTVPETVPYFRFRPPVSPRSPRPNAQFSPKGGREKYACT